MQFVGVHRPSGYPADTLVHGCHTFWSVSYENVPKFEVFWWGNWEVCLKFDDWWWRVGPCSWRLCSLLVSIERLATQQTPLFTGAIRFEVFLMKMYQSLKCSDEETGKCASNLMIEDEGQVLAHEGYAVCWCPSSVWLPSRHPCSRVPYVFMFFLWKCTKVWSVLMRKLGSVPQIWWLGMKGRSLPMKGMQFFGVHRASGYPADTLVHMYHTFSCFFCENVPKFEVFWWGNWEVCLKFDDWGWRAGPCPWRVCSLLVSIERLATQPTPLFTGTLRVDVFLMKMYKSLKCSDEETGKCASNLMIEDEGQVLAHEGYAVCWCPSSVWLPSRHPCSRVPYVFLLFLWKCTKVWSVLMRKLGSVPQIWWLVMKGRSLPMKGMQFVGVHRASGYPADTLVHGYSPCWCISYENVQKFEVFWWGNWEVCLKFDDWGWRVGPCPWRVCSLLVSIERLATQQTLLFTGTIRFEVFLMIMYKSLKCSDEETGKCASNLMIEDEGQVLAHEGYAVCWCPSSVWLPSRHPCSRVVSVLMYFLWKCTKVWSVLMRKLGSVPQIWWLEMEGRFFPMKGMQCFSVHRASGYPSDTLVHGYHPFSCVLLWKCTRVWSVLMRKLGSVPQIWWLMMEGRSLPMKGMQFVGVHRASGYPADTLVQGNSPCWCISYENVQEFEVFWWGNWEVCLKFDDWGWRAGSCPWRLCSLLVSIERLATQQTPLFTGTARFLVFCVKMYRSLKCSEEETGKCASNMIVGDGG